MKKIFQYILLFFLISFWGIILTDKESVRENFQEITGIGLPCSRPLGYAIGEIDPRFGISRENLLASVSQAEKIWEDPSGKELFRYDPEAPLRINLVFDERQLQTDKAEIMENRLEGLDSAHESTLDEYNSLAQKYDKRRSTYESRAAEYKKRIDEYNNDARKFNSEGGATEEAYEKLQKEKDALKKMYEELEKERKSLSVLSAQTNQAAKKENEIVSRYNSEARNYNDEFGGSKEFEKGVYDGENINIYEFKGSEDLEMTLIHEFGHALGIGHLARPESIMYYLMGQQELENPKLTEEDLAALKNTCRIK